MAFQEGRIVERDQDVHPPRHFLLRGPYPSGGIGLILLILIILLLLGRI